MPRASRAAGPTQELIPPLWIEGAPWCTSVRPSGGLCLQSGGSRTLTPVGENQRPALHNQTDGSTGAGGPTLPSTLKATLGRPAAATCQLARFDLGHYKLAPGVGAGRVY